MSVDPYAQPETEAGFDPRQRASTANTLGLVAVALCLGTVCASCATLLPALIVGILAVVQSRSVLAVSSDEVAVVQARNGQILGMLATGYSGLLLLLLLAYLLLYAGIFGAVLMAEL